jgi:hypothetical protein
LKSRRTKSSSSFSFVAVLVLLPRPCFIFETSLLVQSFVFLGKTSVFSPLHSCDKPIRKFLNILEVNLHVQSSILLRKPPCSVLHILEVNFRVQSSIFLR